MDKSLDKKIKELQRERTLQLIYAAMRFNDGTYNTLQFETGITWIKNNISVSDDQIVKVIAECRLFWAWWRNQWALRDEKFVFQASLDRQILPLEGETMGIALDLYYDLHNVRNLHVIPNVWVLNEINSALRRFAAIELQKLKEKIGIETPKK